MRIDEWANDPRQPVRHFKVGVFPWDDRNTRFNAYIRDYNPQWDRCCEHVVIADNGTAAKRAAIAEHKETCVIHPLAT